MRLRFLPHVAALFLLVCGCRSDQPVDSKALPPERALVSWSFDQAPASQPPERFVVRQNHPSHEMAVWQVVADPAAPSAPNVLRVATHNANPTYNLTLIEGTAFGDVDVRVQVRGNTGQDDQGGGLIWRAKDEDNYYVCRINPLEPNFRVYKVVGGKREQLQTAQVQTQTGAWHALRAVMRGDHIECYLDGHKLLDVQDATFKDPGMIGLWTKADACSSFDDLAVFPGEPAAATRAE